MLWFIVVPLLMLVFVANISHAPELLLRQVAVIVSLSVSVSVMFSMTFSGSLVFPSFGLSSE